ALAHVEAAGAEPHPLLGVGDGTGQAEGVLLRQLQEVEGDALGRLGPDPRELAQLVDEVLDRGGVGAGHGARTGYWPRMVPRGPIACFGASAICEVRSRSAASTRSATRSA